LIKLPCKPAIHAVKDKTDEVKDSKECLVGIANSKSYEIYDDPEIPNNIRDVKINWWHFLRRCLCHGRSGAIKFSETGSSSLDGSSKLIGVPVEDARRRRSARRRPGKGLAPSSPARG
jgi:hypothetical protein